MFMWISSNQVSLMYVNLFPDYLRNLMSLSYMSAFKCTVCDWQPVQGVRQPGLAPLHPIRVHFNLCLTALSHFLFPHDPLVLDQCH